MFDGIRINSNGHVQSISFTADQRRDSNEFEWGAREISSTTGDKQDDLFALRWDSNEFEWGAHEISLFALRAATRRRQVTKPERLSHVGRGESIRASMCSCQALTSVQASRDQVILL